MKFVLLVVYIVFFMSASAQHPNWQNKDLAKDSIFGISTEKAYTELLQNKKAKTVLVAVIDGGVDTAHEDLKTIIWNNPKEHYDGVDDDHNGYIDDVHGWDFIGGPKGDINQENLEETRIVRSRKRYFDSLQAADVPATLQSMYDSFRIMEKDLDTKLAEAQNNYREIGAFKQVLDSMILKTGTKNPSTQDLQNEQPADEREKQVKEIVLSHLGGNTDFSSYDNAVNEEYDYYKTQAEYNLNINFAPRAIVGDDSSNVNQREYGNADVMGPNANHATHVSGIIGGMRNNNLGADGIADHVQIMSVRVVPDGDERDKDVANGIRYAADNGARVINMSFGKDYSPDKAVVDEAVRYAMKKDVLIIHAAGNDGKNLDSSNNFPTRRYADGKGEAGAWIEVGASDATDDSTLVASFSNYGHTTVDVFAPGVQIYSSVPGSKYAYYDGTSMASPVVAGLAALIREYYPKLTATQVKDIIMRSVVKVNHEVIVKNGKGEKIYVPFSSICLSGGVVNAYNAFQLASHYRKK
jgi:cell wall-associated protease